MGSFILGVLEQGYSREVGQVDLVSELLLLVRLVDGERVGSQYEVDGPPGLSASCQTTDTERGGRRPTLVLEVRLCT